MFITNKDYEGILKSKEDLLKRLNIEKKNQPSEERGDIDRNKTITSRESIEYITFII